MDRLRRKGPPRSDLQAPLPAPGRAAARPAGKSAAGRRASPGRRRSPGSRRAAARSGCEPAWRTA
eukprot:8695225-Pyramimonas_sp.AAC.1